MRKHLLFLVASVTTIITFNQGCKPKDDHVHNDTELITTIKLVFTDSANTGNILTFNFRDIDGAGGNAPTQFDSIKLAANKTYNLNILLLDESKTPTDTTSNEVLEEGVDHQFFYNISLGLNIVTTYSDNDVNNLPIGLQSKWKTGAASNGNSTVILKHQPNTKDGNQATGESDVEIIFPTKVQ